MTSPQGRFADSAARLDGSCLRRVEAYGKHLFYRWEGGEVLHVHLGLFGKFVMHPAGSLPPAGAAVRARFVSERGALDLSGPTVCELGSPDLVADIAKRLGPDPLRRNADPAAVWAKVSRAARPIGALLLDQKVLSGVGNVYRAEALLVARIDPYRPGTSLSSDEFDLLWSTITDMLRAGVRRNKIITVDPRSIGKPIAEISRAEATWVYGRELCRVCNGPVRRAELAARTMYSCPACQR